MGMAASQARLLTITARLADNELRSQTINNAKMRLAAQSSQASENYINALNNAVLKFSNYDEAGEAMSQALTFNALTAYSSYNTQYGLTNSSGQILVSEGEAAIFKNCGNNLNNYLKAHGLEYKTTYFDEVGAFKNVSYPAPFNDISPEELSKYYTQYDSYESSVEVENFRQAYQAFSTASTNLEKAKGYIVGTYILNGNENTILATSSSGSDYKMANLNGYNMKYTLDNFKEAFTANYNKYNIETLHNQNYISDVIYAELLNEINSISVKHIGGEIYEGKIQDELTYRTTIDSDNNKTIYEFEKGFKITVDNEGAFANKVTAFDATELKLDFTEEEEDDDDDDDNDVYKLLGNIETGELNALTIEEFINSIKYKLEKTDLSGNKTTVDCEYSSENGKFYSNTIIDSLNEFREYLANSKTSYLIKRIMSNINTEKLIEDIRKNPSGSGIDLDTRITSANNKTIYQIIDEYNEAKSKFLGKIFGITSKNVTEDMGLEYVTMYDAEGNPYKARNEVDDKQLLVCQENLQDIEFIMQYVKQYDDIDITESFENVVKEYIIDQLIETYGTPKYAWVDENDTANTGNADAKAQWYTNLFNRMQQGYKALENGLTSSKEWIEYALKSGIVSMEQVDKSFRWNSMDYKTCTRITEETDDAAVAKAEAEYNRAMNDIKAKDNIYDLELKNIDTEHTSLQTEYDVIKDVMKKNIERTMKFNQNA